MSSMLRQYRRFLSAGDAGATMLEYILTAVGIAVVVGVAAAAFGGRVALLFNVTI